MANPNFDPVHSTNNIWRDQDDTICLEDDLDAIESDISDLQTGKADTDHTHTGYAAANHTHTEYAPATHTHTEYAAADHTHTGFAAENHTHSEYASVSHTHSEYAPASHTHTEYAGATHSHAMTDVTGLETALSGKAASDHTHTQYAASSHSHALADVTGLGTALDGKAATSHTHAQSDVTGLTDSLGAKADLVDGKVPTAQLPSYVDDVLEYSSLSSFPTTGESGKIYVATETNKTYRWSGTAYVEISESLALGETASTAYRGDRGKTAYDHSQNGDVHVTAAQKQAWDGKAAGDHTHSAATTSANGFMSSSDKSKLDGIDDGANNYTHPSYTAKGSGLYKVTVDASGHVSAATAVTKSDITALGIPGSDTNTTYSEMTGATSSAAGTAGLVPAPAAGKQAQYLRGDGTWATPTNTTYSNATTSAAGLMSAADKAKLDGIATGANKTTVDSALSSTSTNPVQNKVINSALAGKAESDHTHSEYTTLLAVHPVGSIYLTTNSANPSTLFGGTWEAFGTGRVLMGVPDGGTAGATGGSEEATIPAHKHSTQGHVLTVEEMPSHQHNLLNYNENGITTVPYTNSSVQANIKKGFGGNVMTDFNGSGQSHSHGDTGEAAAQTISVVQPYITCYMWRRTA